MNTSYKHAQLEQFRRDAKRLARLDAIPLSQALDKVAAAKGWSNWSLLAKHSVSAITAGAVPTPRRQSAPMAGPAGLNSPPSSPTTKHPYFDSLPRYYIHGDQSESNASLYYCARCDVFFDAAHFSDHKDINGDRYLASVTSWNRRDPSRLDTRRRPTNAINVLAAAAIAEKAAYEASRAPFHLWLESQYAKQEPVGDLARDILHDKLFPVSATTRAEVEEHLDMHGAVPGALAALKLAWARFTASQKRAARRLQRVSLTPGAAPQPVLPRPPTP